MQVAQVVSINELPALATQTAPSARARDNCVCVCAEARSRISRLKLQQLQAACILAVVAAMEVWTVVSGRKHLELRVPMLTAGALGVSHTLFDALYATSLPFAKSL